MKSIFATAIIAISAIAAFAQTGRITGTVSYGDNVVVHNATVEIAQTRQATETAKDGTFEISNPRTHFTKRYPRR